MKKHLHTGLVACSALLLAFHAGGAAAQAAKPAMVAAGTYECWANGSARGMMNFKVTGKGMYAGDGDKGRYEYDAASGKITFKGGHLDGVMPAGFVSVYHEPRGRPTVSFRSGRGSEASFCERVGK